MVKTYTGLLTDYLKDKPVLSITVVNRWMTISLKNLKDDNWISHICGITSLNLDDAKLIPITQRNGSIRTCIVRNGNKYMSVMIGANQIAMPKDEKTWNLLK